MKNWKVMPTNTPRGVLNNNPGNIKRTKINWLNEVGCPDTEFECFKNPVDGLRAIFKILKTYRSKKIDTINEIIRRWSATNQDEYVSFIETFAAYDKDAQLPDTKAMFITLAQGIVIFENGFNPYNLRLYITAWELSNES